MAAAARLGVRFVAMGEPDYPKTLQAIDTAPPLIALRGAAALLARPSVAIVGSRNASASGLTFAERLARQLGEAGYVVVSGLARGIDTRAHKASLETGTVAVLAGGHDRIYPSENEPLLNAILEQGGAVISEMPMGWEPRGRDFPRRNRIVSGLSYGVVVVEAARRSGSLITARFALEQGREVFAVPGSPLDPRAEGTNDLIRDGATLCAGVEHVTSVLEPLIAAGPRLDRSAEEPHHAVGSEELWDELDLPDIVRAPVRPVMPDDGGDEPAGERRSHSLPRTLAGRHRRSRAAIGASDPQRADGPAGAGDRRAPRAPWRQRGVADRSALSGLRRLSRPTERPGSPPAAPCREDRPEGRASPAGRGRRAQPRIPQHIAPSPPGTSAARGRPASCAASRLLGRRDGEGSARGFRHRGRRCLFVAITPR